MILIQDPDIPAEIRRAIASAESRVVSLSELQDWAGAYEAFSELYSELVTAQPQGRRFHKGYPLHNMGLAKLFLGDVKEAARLTFLAFFEDALSRGEESPQSIDEISRPAEPQPPVCVSVPGPALLGIARYIRELPQQGVVVADPADLLGDPRVAGVARLVRPPEDVRLPGQFESPWERRVFIGGFYGDLPRLRILRDLLRECGLDGVIAADFYRPTDMSVRNHALMLLHECSAAVFDVTHRGDHAAEMDRLGDYGIQYLRVIFDPSDPDAPQLGGMTRSTLEERELSPMDVAEEALEAFARAVCSDRTVGQASAFSSERPS